MDYSQWTSSSASSPFSLTTDDSSPEAIVNVNGHGEKVTPPSTMPQQIMRTVAGNFNQVFGMGADVKPIINGSHSGQQQHSIPPPSAFARLPPKHHNTSLSHGSNTAPSGGAKHDKPPRRFPTDQLPLLSPPVNEMFDGDRSNGAVLLQGDPQVITKQRVETAIRVILDFCHYIPTHVVPPPLDPAVHPLLPRGPDGNFLRHLARTGTFKTLRLQAGATTKQMSKKQEQARELARKGDPYGLDQSTLYLETAVYKSDGQTRVYACKRCRAREEKRRKTKESSRKTPLTEPSGHANPKSSLSPRPKSEVSPSPDYVTGDNADDYDPMKGRQTVEEPHWDPHVPDWRHEIITFNSSPEWPFKEPGTVDWLPLRVICYGKCHGEKTGFKIKFTVRTHDGRIFASSMTEPIRITDDHKTDKAKPRTEMSRTAPAARSRKGTSVMSSRRTSPNLSDESQQSMSQAGAVVQKYIPQSKGNKPYDRPPALNRHNSASSVHSVASLSAVSTEMRNQFPDIPTTSSDWTNVDHTAAFNLRQPFRGTMTPLHGDTSSYTSSNPPSVHSSARQSPLVLQDDLPLDLQAQFSGLGQLDQSLGQLSDQQSQQPRMLPAQATSPMLFNGVNGLHQFDASDPFSSLHRPQPSFSAGSYTSSFMSDASALGLDMSGSLFSESGLPPSSADGDENMMDYLSFEADGGEFSTQPQAAFQPTEAPRMVASSQTTQANHQSQPNQSAAPANTAPAQPERTPPIIGMVAPESGPMSGGPNVIILGHNFTQDMVVTFGGRPATLISSSDTVLACVLPPGAAPGPVELKVQDSNTSASREFIYNGVTQEAMELALQVRNHGPSGSNGNGNGNGAGFPAMTQPNGNSNGTGTSNGGNNTQAGSYSAQNNLQTTLTDFIASIDEPSPGSLRHSGAINTRNTAQQTLVHLATVLGYEKLLRHLLVYGAQLDIPDVNGFTPLAFAAHCNQISCARVLIQAGATYDVPTSMGEFPLDLARAAGNTAIEQLLLSAVWSTAAATSTTPGTVIDTIDEGGLSASEVEDELLSSDDDEHAVETDSELDSDNPSDESDDDVDAFADKAPVRRPSRHKGARPRIIIPDNMSIRANAPTSIRNSLSEEIDSGDDDDSEVSALDSLRLSPRTRARRSSAHSADKVLTRSQSPTIDTPPPYSPASWRDKFPLTEQWKIPIAPQPLASMFYPKAADMPTDGAWITLPVSTPSWETLQKLTSPEEVKAFTQAMTAAALNAIVSSGATTATTTATTATPQKAKKRRSPRRSSGSGNGSAGHLSASASANPASTALSTTSTGGTGTVTMDSVSTAASKVIKPVKRDRMLFYFWLPLLLFFGFWTIITMLPIITAFGLFYARTIRQIIKQRL